MLRDDVCVNDFRTERDRESERNTHTLNTHSHTHNFSRRQLLVHTQPNRRSYFTRYVSVANDMRLMVSSPDTRARITGQCILLLVTRSDLYYYIEVILVFAICVMRCVGKQFLKSNKYTIKICSLDNQRLND